ncbi:Acetyltransferase involved in cellulose biosynthesis, CelD/BcsL family [Sinosporangium album]|uniref:Acetyltransferase involved in cellulose biosynthesis, CelD/BcsL family n=1 Tax=Sinosporangium album TaxID=504805 RepID=A0A1G7QLD4_9ACTN|nr:GNAT family N-acetyltransferase [Sinosporangium album]SDF99361.1 Acetyltransferase involved in cellulose biosynthesis, CelD/BcsL family [Sinosporangium album]
MSEYGPPDGVDVRTPVPDEVWRRLLGQEARDALPSQTPAWRDAVCTHGWQDASRLYIWGDNGGDAVQILVPLVRSGTGRAAEYASWPVGWGVGGVVAAPEAVTAARAGAVLRDLASLPARRIYLRPPPASTALWDGLVPPDAVRNPRMTQVLDLREGLDHLWRRRFHANVRNAVRRAERAGLTIEQDATGRLIPDFYRLFELSIDRWAEQSDESDVEVRRRVREKNPQSKFAAVARHLGPDCHVWLARRAGEHGEPVAALLALHRGPHVVYWQAAMDKAPAARTKAATYLLYLLIEDACARGARSLHMGDTYPGTSVTTFKEAFGPDAYHTAGYWIPGSAASAADAVPVRKEGITTP